MGKSFKNNIKKYKRHKTILLYEVIRRKQSAGIHFDACSSMYNKFPTKLPAS
jgi:hypothetical protein